MGVLKEECFVGEVRQSFTDPNNIKALGISGPGGEVLAHLLSIKLDKLHLPTLFTNGGEGCVVLS